MSGQVGRRDVTEDADVVKLDLLLAVGKVASDWLAVEGIPQVLRQDAAVTRHDREQAAQLAGAHDGAMLVATIGLEALEVADEGLPRADPAHLQLAIGWLDERDDGARHVIGHAFRHTVATLALDAGEGLDAVSRALGHTSVATTADIYGHWTPAMQERLALRMAEVLG